jgi:hypothetical protein
MSPVTVGALISFLISLELILPVITASRFMFDIAIWWLTKPLNFVLKLLLFHWSSIALLSLIGTLFTSFYPGLKFPAPNP